MVVLKEFPELSSSISISFLLATEDAAVLRLESLPPLSVWTAKLVVIGWEETEVVIDVTDAWYLWASFRWLLIVEHSA